MNKNQLIFDLYVVYQKMKEERLARNLELWPQQDYDDLISLLRDTDWKSFGKEELDKVDWINTRYFGRGEIALLYCPKIISYDEIVAAKDALRSIMESIQSKIRDKQAGVDS
jgi:hypothetical protein